MEVYRLINFTLQSLYLIVHILFIRRLFRRRQPSPIWIWFAIFSIATWIWVSGRFMESVVYLFFPNDNDAYVFAANYQYIGNTTALIAYVIWNLYLAGHDELASHPFVRIVLFSYPILISILVFSNPHHQFFYTKLVMGQQVVHGPLFKPFLISGYLILLWGYLVSIIHIFQTDYDRIKRLVMFSLFPLLPALAILIRTLSGIDKLDYTPIIMAISFYCLDLIIFKYNYVNIIPSSIESIVEHTSCPIAIYDSDHKRLLYSNKVAREYYGQALESFLPLLDGGSHSLEGQFDGKSLKIKTSFLPDDHAVVITAVDMTEIAIEQARIDGQIQELNDLSHLLEEEKRNIDAYLDSLYQIEGLRDKLELISRTQESITQVSKAVEGNLKEAQKSPSTGEGPLKDNLDLTKSCISMIRRTVVKLREV